MKFICLADTHNQHDDFDVPDGDVLIVAGDFTMRGIPKEIRKFNDFLGSLPHEFKVVIAGNHDWLFEREPKRAQELLTNCIYLEDSLTTIAGIKIYGSPWQPWFHDWAFNLQRGLPLKNKWDLIPDDIDILITHGPPSSHGDVTLRGESTGCVDLLDAIKRVKPKYNIFGHIHEGYGTTMEGDTTCINASNVDFYYSPVNPPISFEL